MVNQPGGGDGATAGRPRRRRGVAAARRFAPPAQRAGVARLAAPHAAGASAGTANRGGPGGGAIRWFPRPPAVAVAGGGTKPP